MAVGFTWIFRNPDSKRELRSLNIDMAEVSLPLAASLRLKEGTLHLSGNGSWSPQGFASTGDFDVQAMAWQHKTFSGHDLSARGEFAVDPRQFSISKTEGQFLRGSFVADADVVNWQLHQKRQGTNNSAAFW